MLPVVAFFICEGCLDILKYSTPIEHLLGPGHKSRHVKGQNGGQVKESRYLDWNPTLTLKVSIVYTNQSPGLLPLLSLFSFWWFTQMFFIFTALLFFKILIVVKYVLNSSWIGLFFNVKLYERNSWCDPGLGSSWRLWVFLIPITSSVDTTHGGFSWTEVLQVRVNWHFIFRCLGKLKKSRFPNCYCIAVFEGWWSHVLP